jgi:peptidoglycan/LPS O-acetylase OafA/YrhL
MASRGVPVNVYNSTMISIIFIVIILNLATNNKTLVQFEHPILDRLGQISYGLYLYHFPVLYIFLIGAPKLGLVQQANLLQPFIFFSVLIGTWLISEVSYRWYESPFLRLKEKHSVLPSG